MNKSGLVDEVKERLGVSAARARTLVDAVLEEMQEALARRQKVSLRGLGVLELVEDGTGTVLRFEPARALSEATDRGTGTSVPAKKAPVKKAPAKKTPATKGAAKTAPARKAPAKKAPAKKAPAKKAPAKKAPAKKAPAKKAAPVPPPVATEPQVVPYEPLHDPAADALAAVAAEQRRPVVSAEPDLTDPLLPGEVVPPVDEQPDTLVYTSGDAATNETIGELTDQP